MKIITTAQEKKALNIITKLRRAILNDNFTERLTAVEELAELTGIIGGIKGLQRELEIIENDLELSRLEMDRADEVEEASKRIGSRYYGPDICSKCAHRNDLMSKVREEPSIFCERWKSMVNSFDHCSYFEEVKHD